MKKLLLSIVFALTPALYAGGDITPTIENNSALYIGIGASMMSLNADLTDESMETIGGTIQVGYEYNKYIAVELRYTANVAKIEYDPGTTANITNDDYPANFTNIGIYLKPTYPIGDLSLYGLIGYGSTTFTNLPVGGGDRTESSFQYGVGASYRTTENISLFVDYVNLYDDAGIDGHFIASDILIEVVTVGVSYRF